MDYKELFSKIDFNQDEFALAPDEDAIVIINDGVYQSMLVHDICWAYDNADMITDRVTILKEMRPELKEKMWAFVFSEKFVDAIDIEYLG